MLNKFVQLTALTRLTLPAVGAMAITRASEAAMNAVMRFTPTLTEVRAGKLRVLAN